ncbi:MAG: hypothetical protein K9F98_04715 [Candidatus Planktophila sp.]|nr:hypothetical protein [Candidatus Planktophila sp.]
MKLSRFIAPVLVLTIFLTGCSLLPLSADEKKYVDNCQIVYGNYQKYMKLQTKFTEAEYNDTDYDWESWPSTYAVTNAGESSRDLTSSAIERQFPWIKELINDYFQNIDKKDFLEKESTDWLDDDLVGKAIEAFFIQMAKGSAFKVTRSNLKKSGDYLYDYEINQVFAQYSPSDRFKNCDEAIGLDESSSMEIKWTDYDLRGSTGVSLQTVLYVSVELWGCNNFGVGFIDYGKGWQRCAGSDFDSSKYATLGSNVVTDEERAILEERGLAAEREAQAPSSEYSNVTPLQGCTSLGQVVQTQSYGQLTCKLVLMNRIKALVWMRS